MQTPQPPLLPLLLHLVLWVQAPRPLLLPSPPLLLLLLCRHSARLHYPLPLLLLVVAWMLLLLLLRRRRQLLQSRVQLQLPACPASPAGRSTHLLLR